MTVTQAIMDVGWKDHTRPYYNRGEPSKQGLIMWIPCTDRSRMIINDRCRGGAVPQWVFTSPPDQAYAVLDTEPTRYAQYIITQTNPGILQDTIYGPGSPTAAWNNIYVPGDQIGLAGDFTILYRFMYLTYSPYGNRTYPLLKVTQAPQFGWAVWIYSPQVLTVESYTNVKTASCTATMPFVLGQFCSLVITRAASVNSGFPRAWLNGINYTMTNTGTWFPQEIKSVKLCVGMWINQDVMNGTFTELRLYNRAMDDSEIALLQSSLG